MDESDKLLAYDLEAFYKQNWQQMSFEDGLAIAKAYLVVKKVLTSASAQEGEPDEDEILSLFGHRPDSRASQDDSEHLWIQPEAQEGIPDWLESLGPERSEHIDGVPQREKTASSNS